MAEPAIDPEDLDTPAIEFDPKMWWRLFQYGLAYPRTLLVILVSATMVGVIDMIFGLLTKFTVDDIQLHGKEADLLQWAILYASAGLVISVSLGTFIWFVNRLRIWVGYDLRQAAFANLQRLSFSYFDRRPVGWLMARLTSDCDRLTRILSWGTLDLIWSVTLMSAIAIAMLALHWQLAVYALSVTPLVAWVTVKFRRRILDAARGVRQTNSQITGTFNESIMGVVTSKAYGREQANLTDFQVLSDKLYSASVRNLRLTAIYVPLTVTIGSAGIAITLALGGSELLAGGILAGTLIAFLSWTRFFFEPIEELSFWFAQMQMAQASAERLFGVIDAQPAIADSESVRERVHQYSEQLPNPSLARDGRPNRIETLEARNLDFWYDPAKPVLRSLNLTINHGESVALVGPTGGGKTTLANILCRFYEPVKGQVLINGEDYRSRSLEWYQSNLSIVLQEAHLFSGTIAENIRYGLLRAAETDIVMAAKLAGAHGFISCMEDGYETQVGEAGSRLSSGQKQLISIARATLADRQILLLDEATSSVDTETEREIQEGLERLFWGRISIVIAHRLSTIRNANTIVFIDEGRIIEQGTHVELMTLGGRYAELSMQQAPDHGRHDWRSIALAPSEERRASE